MPCPPSKARSIALYAGLILDLSVSSATIMADDQSSDAQFVQSGPETQSSSEFDSKKIETAGAIIGKITIRNRNIFDLSNPLEDKWLYRWANRLHIVTKPHVIESQLLIEEGDTYSARLSDESERILRLNAYLNEADITPVHYENGVVDLEVETTDVWTLTPDVLLRRSGGENQLGIGILERNLLGRGIKLGVKYKSTVDRDTLSLTYVDNNFLNDHYQLAARVSDNSDGFFQGLAFGQPFYAFDRRNAGGISFARGEQIDQLYDRGDVVAEFNHRFDYDEASLGWSRGLRNGWVKRYTAGVAYSRNEFDETPDNLLPVSILPDDRKYFYPFVGFELVEDHYETTVNFDQIERTEDRLLGTWLNVRLGYSSRSAGSTNNAWHYRAGFSNALVSTKKTSLTVRSDLSGRWENGGAQNALLSGVMRFHRRLTEHQLFYVSLSGTISKNLDIDNPLYLGGETGLRGYPLRYQNGDSKALVTLEQRIFTDWYPFRLVHVGGALFFDAGRTWGESPVGALNLGVLKDVGFGFRLGSPRAGRRVLHIDIAFPLDGEDNIDKVQILVDAKSSF